MTREQTLALFTQGRDAWNAWAQEMLARRENVQAASSSAPAAPTNEAKDSNWI